MKLTYAYLSALLLPLLSVSDACALDLKLSCTGINTHTYSPKQVSKNPHSSRENKNQVFVIQGDELLLESSKLQEGYFISGRTILIESIPCDITENKIQCLDGWDIEPSPDEDIPQVYLYNLEVSRVNGEVKERVASSTSWAFISETFEGNCKNVSNRF